MSFNDEFFGRATKINKTIDGTLHTLGLKFDVKEEYQNQVVVTGAAKTVVDLGGNKKRIVCNRGIQTFGYTTVIGGETQYITVNALTGGNIAEPLETMNIYSISNPLRSQRGSFSDSRALKFFSVRAQDGIDYAIDSNSPLAVSPDEIAWQGTDPITPVSEFTVSFARLTFEEIDRSLNPNAVYRHDTTVGSFFVNAATLDDGVTTTVLTRKIFDSEPSYYPPNAKLLSGEYWVDTQAAELVLGGASESLGTNAAISYWHEDIEVFQSTGTTFEILNIEGDGTLTGYAGTSDSIFMFGQNKIYGSHEFAVYDSAANGWGKGSIEFRADSEDDSALVALEWDGTTFTAYQRTSKGATISSPSVAVPPADIYSGTVFYIKITRSSSNPDEIQIEVTNQNRTSTVIMYTGTISILANQSGFYGVSIYGSNKVKVEGFPIGENLKALGTAKVSSLKITNYTGVTYFQTFSRASSNTLDSVENVSTGSNMSQSATPARNTYDLDGSNNFVFSRECNGDRIKTTFDQEVSAPDKPGQAPRVFDLTDAATQDSSNVNENKLHWHDVVDVWDHNNTLNIADGESFSVVVGIVFDPSSPPNLFYSVKNSGTPEWIAINSSNYTAIWAMGIVALKDSFVQTLPAGREICFKVTGDRIVNRGGFDQAYINEHVATVESLDQAWFLTGESGGLTPKMSGLILSEGPGWYGLTCDTTSTSSPRLAVAGYRIGASKELITGHQDAGGDRWILDGSFLAWSFATGTSAPVNEFECGLTYDDKLANTDGVFLGAFFPEFATAVNRFGGLINDTSLSSGFSLSGTAFNPSLLLKNMASVGATCVEAKMRVKFDGLSVRTQSLTYSKNFNRLIQISLPTEDQYVYFDFTQNGGRQAYEEIEGVRETIANETFGPNSTSGTISFRVMALRKNTSSILLDSGSYYDAEDYDYRYIGSSVSTGSNVNSGFWQIVNATSLVNDMMEFVTSGFNSLFLFPSNAGIDPGVSGTTGQGYLETLLPKYSESSTFISQNVIRYSMSATSQQTSYDNLQIGEIAARFRLPSGLITPFFPVSRGAMFQA